MTAARVVEVRRGGAPDITMLPYAVSLGVRAAVAGSDIVLTVPFADRLVGAPGRLHGGVAAGLLELAGLARLLVELGDDVPPPRFEVVTLTVDYLRGGQLLDIHAAGTMTKLGRRIASLRAAAWQDDRARPIATATINVVFARA